MLYDCLFHYSGNKTFTLPPPIRTFIADHLERDHKASLKEIYQHAKHFFRHCGYDDNFWLRAKQPMCNHRLSIKKKMNQLNSFNGDPESFSAIKQWALSQTYSVLSQDPSFNEHTNFVCAHEFLPDSSAPPVDPTSLRKWNPKHIIRIVFTSISQSMQLPALNLIPSVRDYCVPFSDTTYKLTHIKDFKVSDKILID